MTLADPKSGGWALNEILTSAQMNVVRSELLKAVDGVGGGTYTITGDLTFQGAGDVVFAATARVSGTGTLELVSGALLDVQSGATIDLTNADLNLDNNSTLTLDGTMNVTATGVIQLQASAELVVVSGGDIRVANGGDLIVQSGGTVTIESGATLVSDSGAEILPFHSEDLRITSTRNSNFRHSMTAAYVEEPTAGSPLWSTTIVAGTGRWVQRSVGVDPELAFALNLPVGDVIEQVTVLVDGGTSHSGLPATMPVVDLVRVDDSGSATNVSSATDSSPSVGAYETPHSIILSTSLPHTVTTDAYYIVVHGETGANSLANELAVISVTGLLEQHAYRAERDKL